MPTHAGAGAEGVGDARNRRERAQGKLERPGQISRAVFIGQREGLFVAQAEGARFLVVGDVAAGCLGSQPFAQIALVGSCLGGELGGSDGATGEGFIKAKFFPDDHHAGMHCGAKVAHELADKGIESVHVQGNLRRTHSIGLLFFNGIGPQSNAQRSRSYAMSCGSSGAQAAAMSIRRFPRETLLWLVPFTRPSMQYGHCVCESNTPGNELAILSRNGRPHGEPYPG